MGRMRWLALLACVPGCVYFASDDDGGGQCLDRTAHLEPAPQRNPDTLQCQSIGTGCDPACGPCPLADSPDVTWPVCNGACEGLGEGACAADPNCRVILDAACSIGLTCLTNYIGCYPTDTAVDISVDCFTADAWTCSRSNACTAYHSYASCPANDESCARPFELCTREGTLPGRCWDQVTCRAIGPDCPMGKTPGVSNGCWTGACIPLDLCE
jgi:hypothetical protein